MNLHEENLYSSHFKTSIPLTTEKTQGVQVFTNAGQITYIQNKNESLMRIRLANEKGEENPGVEGVISLTVEIRM